MQTTSLKKNILFTFLASTFGLLLLAFFIEIFFGVLSWYKNIKNPEEKMGVAATEFDSRLGWTPIKNANYFYDGIKISTNSLGFRSSEVDFSKEHVLVLGDSVAFGYGVSDEKTFTHFLMNRFQNKYKNIQVLNLGVSGYGVDQYYLYLKRHIGILKPKIIIILICSRNDLVDTSSESPYGKKKPFFFLDRGVLKQTAKNISYFNCENFFSKSWLLRRSFFASYRKPLCQSESHTIKKTIKVVEVLIKRIKSLAEGYGAKVLFAAVPQRDVFLLDYCDFHPNLSFCKKRDQVFKKDLFKRIEETKKTDPEKYSKIVAGVLAGYNRGKFDLMEFKKLFTATRSNHLDLNYKFLRSGIPIEDFGDLFIDEVHFSARGNFVLAQFFEEYFETNHWLEN
jgi:hypothetical protein